MTISRRCAWLGGCKPQHQVPNPNPNPSRFHETLNPLTTHRDHLPQVLGHGGGGELGRAAHDVVAAATVGPDLGHRQVLRQAQGVALGAQAHVAACSSG